MAITVAIEKYAIAMTAFPTRPVAHHIGPSSAVHVP
jgi:hypothetical protein